jgi:hypothetical protein
MKLALIGAAAVAAAAFATPALAQAVVDPGYCAQSYPSANCQNMGPGNPYTDGGYWQNENAMMPGYTQSAEPDEYQYHGGPKYND